MFGVKGDSPGFVTYLQNCLADRTCYRISPKRVEMQCSSQRFGNCWTVKQDISLT